ncbi:hypothetical protein RRG08_026384 [Elysia crispata]|uniref:Uncharacterized protein n=1 Tax=Elysia crispata TaxID=231223 RepID=A0AAE0XSF3_9GAST|nr:hypothetical protein RRG08_026384 [Elysia crispata]
MWSGPILSTKGVITCPIPYVIEHVHSPSLPLVSSSSTDEFWREDLVWPDPTKRFPETSGIRPGVLSANIKHFRGLQKGMDGGQGGVATRCTSARAVRMPPRPTSLPWNVLVIHSDPPTVDEDDVNKFLLNTLKTGVIMEQQQVADGKAGGRAAGKGREPTQTLSTPSRRRTTSVLAP